MRTTNQTYVSSEDANKSLKRIQEITEKIYLEADEHTQLGNSISIIHDYILQQELRG